MTKHTPTPWRITRFEPADGLCILEGPHGEHITDFVSEANAALIVQAVNAAAPVADAAPASDGWDEVEAIRQAIAPVLDWYQSDEHEPRFTVEIVTDIVADLQSDRAELLQLRKAAPASEDHEELRAEATGWKREADRLLQLCQKQSREIEDLTPYIDLFRRLDRKFGCGHTDHGAEDCEALLRHVDELFDRPDAAPASEARIAEAVRWCETADDDCQCGECKAKRELRAILTGRAAKASD
jgi:hypothetical protein